MIRVAFYKAPGRWEDRLIRWWTGGPYSHCELVIGVADGVMHCASSSGRDGGVRAKAIPAKLHHWDVVEVPWAVAPYKVGDPIRDDGARYDWMGLALSQVFASGRHSPSRWFCSEWVARELGLPHPSRYSPNALYDTLAFLNAVTSPKVG